MDGLWRFGYRLAYRLLRIWWRLRRPLGLGAAVAVWDGDRLLVVRSSYRALLDVPGGGCGTREDLRTAARRELLEETGISAPADALVGPLLVEFTLEHRPIRQAIFTWRPVTAPRPRIDDREIVWADYLRPTELADHPLAPGLRAYLDAAS